jgi:hypothetical protein
VSVQEHQVGPIVEAVENPSEGGRLELPPDHRVFRSEELDPPGDAGDASEPGRLRLDRSPIGEESFGEVRGGFESEPVGEGGLRVEIDRQDPEPASSKSGGEARGGCRLSDAAFVRRDS